jgi:hypothetical protein
LRPFDWLQYRIEVFALKYRDGLSSVVGLKPEVHRVKMNSPKRLFNSYAESSLSTFMIDLVKNTQAEHGCIILERGRRECSPR